MTKKPSQTANNIQVNLSLRSSNKKHHCRDFSDIQTNVLLWGVIFQPGVKFQKN